MCTTYTYESVDTTKYCVWQTQKQPHEVVKICLTRLSDMPHEVRENTLTTFVNTHYDTRNHHTQSQSKCQSLSHTQSQWHTQCRITHHITQCRIAYAITNRQWLRNTYRTSHTQSHNAIAIVTSIVIAHHHHIHITHWYPIRYITSHDLTHHHMTWPITSHDAIVNCYRQSPRHHGLPHG